MFASIFLAAICLLKSMLRYIALVPDGGDFGAQVFDKYQICIALAHALLSACSSITNVGEITKQHTKHMSSFSRRSNLLVLLTLLSNP